MIDRSRGRFGRNAKKMFSAALVFVLGLTVAFIPAAEARHRVRSTAARMPASRTDPIKDAALIVDGVSGKVLFARNADAARHPASLTKLMTVYLLFDALKKGAIKMDDNLTFSYHAARQKPTNMHIATGEKMTVDTAINALLVRSANDVAVAVAEALGGTEAHFADMMNAKARALGMTDTFYRNASGLPDNLQITTATDLAVLARHVAYDFPEYFHYFSKRDFTYRGNRYEGHDNLLGRYVGADGMKTGYTGASGFNLVTSVTRGNVHIIGVVMGGRTAPRRDYEMMAMLDNTFDSIARTPTLVAHAKLPWANGRTGEATVASAGFDIARPITGRLYRVSPDPDDEEAAETRPDFEDGIVPTPAPPKPTVVAAVQPAEKNVRAAKPMLRPKSADIDTSAFGLHDWTIQIGAFADLKQARAQLSAYAEKSMDVLGQAQRIVVPFQSLDGNWLYRARFGPFLEHEARRICARLTDRGQTCFAAIATR
jgi:D-alanyl-D-alanine carboxypeptidase